MTVQFDFVEMIGTESTMVKLSHDGFNFVTFYDSIIQFPCSCNAKCSPQGRSVARTEKELYVVFSQVHPHAPQSLRLHI